jgi:hypothetical protein
MAQIGTNEPTIQDLVSLFGNAGIPATEALNRSEQSRLSHNINQQQALQDIAHKEQNQPVDLEAKVLGNEKTRAQMPRWAMENEALDYNNKVNTGVGTELPIKAKQTELKGRISKERQTEIEDLALEMAADKDPVIAKHGRDLYLSLPSFLKDDLKDERRAKREAENIRLRNELDMKRDAALAKQGRYAPKGANGGTFEEKAWLKNPVAYATMKASQATDTEEKSYWEGMKKAYEHPALKKIEAQAAAAAAASGRLDTAAAAGMPTPQVPRTPEPTIPSKGPGQAAPANAPTAAQPPSTKRITVYKDGKPYNIPENQKEEALKSGYTIK